MNGNYIGTDGNNDNKNYIVPEAYSEAVSEALSAPMAMKSEGQAALFASSNSLLLPDANVIGEMEKAVASATSFNEVGGEIVSTKSGEQTVLHAVPGSAADPSVDSKASVKVGNYADRSAAINAVERLGTFHSHPYGTVTKGIHVYRFNQPPSDKDINNAKSPENRNLPLNNYVIGDKVYIYNGKGVQATVLRKTFFFFWKVGIFMPKYIFIFIITPFLCFYAQNDTIRISTKEEFEDIDEIVSKNTNANTLILDNCLQIGVLPQSIAKLTQLKSIKLDCTDLQVLPDYFKNYHELESISFGSNSKVDIAKSIGILCKMEKLKYLSIYADNISRLPFEIGQLKRLEVLDLSFNKIEKLPPTFGNLTNLKTLNISDNPISIDSLLPLLARLPLLTELNLIDCKLESLPSSISLLSNLEALLLIRNKLEYLPSEISGLKKLKYLMMTGNNLKDLPLEITQLKELSLIVIGGHSIDKKKVEYIRKSMPNCTILE